MHELCFPVGMRFVGAFRSTGRRRYFPRIDYGNTGARRKPREGPAETAGGPGGNRYR